MDMVEEAVCPFFDTSFVDFVWIKAKLDPKWISRANFHSHVQC
jgi:hypothetical protein